MGGNGLRENFLLVKIEKFILFLCVIYEIVKGFGLFFGVYMYKVFWRVNFNCFDILNLFENLIGGL